MQGSWSGSFPEDLPRPTLFPIVGSAHVSLQTSPQTHTKHSHSHYTPVRRLCSHCRVISCRLEHLFGALSLHLWGAFYCVFATMALTFASHLASLRGRPLTYNLAPYDCTVSSSRSSRSRIPNVEPYRRCESEGPVGRVRYRPACT